MSQTENWDEYDFTDLDTHFFIPDINYPDWPYDVCFWDGGSLAFTPNAILINDGWQDEFQNGIETVFYNRLRPGSVFSVDIFGLALPLKTEASVEVRVDNITVTLSDAEMPVIIDPGKSYWWHVFYVDLSGNIVIINEVNDNEPELDDLTQKIIDLSWYSDYDLDLDGHFFVPSLSDSKIYFDVNWNNEGKINYFPFANYLYDDYGYSGNEYIGVDQIVSGSEFCVNLFSIDETEEIFPVDLTDIEVKFNNQTFNIENATGTGKWWHVFKVKNNGSEQLNQ